MSKEELQKTLDEIRSLKCRVDVLEEKISGRLTLIERDIKSVRKPLGVIITLIVTATIGAMLSLVLTSL